MLSNQNSKIAIKVENVSKTFKIPHEKIDSVRGAFVNALKKRTYEEFKALDNVSFEVKKGEFFGIIGRNGGGKSTLLKILAGIYRPDKGKIKINGKISPFLELGIGFNPELSGRDNIYLNASVLGLSKKQIDKKFDDIVAFSELERFIDQKLKNYSSGMQVRLAFSVAIHANRDILLMDEVLAVGDNNFQSKCLEEFNKYRDLGKTVILVSHDISTIQKYCDRAMLLRKGKIEMIGNPEKIGNKYIYQNMSDEEKRILDKEKWNNKNKKGKQKTKGSKKVAEIVKVELFDKKGQKKNVFRTREDIIMKVIIHARHTKNKRIDVGVGLYNAYTGKHVFGCTTYSDKHDFELKQGKNTISLIFNNIPLLEGLYYINISCVNRNNKKLLDVAERVKDIKIYSTLENHDYKGSVLLKHCWF